MESALFLTDLLTAHEPMEIPRTRPADTLSPSGGEGRVKGIGSWEASTISGSRIGTMNPPLPLPGGEPRFGRLLHVPLLGGVQGWVGSWEEFRRNSEVGFLQKNLWDWNCV